MKGTHLSCTFLFLKNIPKVNKPNKGPYVYDAILKIMLTTDASFMALKTTMTPNITKQKIKWIIFRVVTFFGLFAFSGLSIPKKSIQKDVVSAVKAESVVAKVAAINPNKKTTAGNNAK